MPAKRPVHPTHNGRTCLRLRGQARSYRSAVRQLLCGVTTDAFPAKAGPTKVRGVSRRPASARKRPASATRSHCSPPIGVGARLPAKRPVHPTHNGRTCLRIRGQARSYRSAVRQLPCGVTTDAFPAKAGPTKVRGVSVDRSIQPGKDQRLPPDLTVRRRSV